MLINYLKAMATADRIEFAARCGTSVEYLFQIARGLRKPKIALAVAIERESGGAVRCEKLLPDVDWVYLRSERAA